MEYELKFDPKTIEHLGVKMYSTLPPALSEIISNAYDADADSVVLTFNEQNKVPLSITVSDDGYGMSSKEVQEKFLVIGRNRRNTDGDKPSEKHKRLPTGKKGLGKLALFGLAKVITVDTVKDGYRNRFTLEWESLLSADGVYNPKMEVINEKTNKNSGTTIKLSQLKRKTPFDLESLADSMSKIFIIDTSFSIKLKSTDGTETIVDNERKYKQVEEQFIWNETDLVPEDSEYSEITLRLMTSKTPIPPNSGLRGITLFSRGKLVNSPEYFASSTSSHFFQYLTGWIKADFIDELDEDVISTNRQSINWDNPEMEKFREFLSNIIMTVSREWRKKREDKKTKDFNENTGIDKDKWFSTMSNDVRKPLQKIVDTMTKNEEIDSTYLPVIEALYEIVPEYPDLHWRHLHEGIRDRVKHYYSNSQFAEAADQGTKIYAQKLRNLSGSFEDGVKLSGDVFGGKVPKIKIADVSKASGYNIQQGQLHLTNGVMTGFRNPINQAPIDELVPSTFSKLDCLNILSLISYLTTRLDNILEDEDH
jgi:uncharacterized protein (TIGR02391 family)